MTLVKSYARQAVEAVDQLHRVAYGGGGVHIGWNGNVRQLLGQADEAVLEGYGKGAIRALQGALDFIEGDVSRIPENPKIYELIAQAKIAIQQADAAVRLGELEL